MSALLGLLLWCGVGAGAEVPTAGGPFVSVPFAEACAAAGRAHKLVLIYFDEAGNADCTRFDEQTWTDGGVRKWMAEHAVAMQPLAAEGELLAARFAVTAVPTVIVVSPRGLKRAHLTGFHEPAALLEALDARLRDTDPVAVTLRRLEEAGASDAPARIAHARALAEAGRQEEALAQFLRCLDAAGEKEGRLGGGAQLVAVTEIGELAADYPPAREALRTRRDAARERLLSGTARQLDPALLAMMNTELGDIEGTLSLYQQMHTQQPHSVMTGLLRQYAVDSLLKAHRYAEIAELIDVKAAVRRAYDLHQEDSQRPLPGGGGDVERFRAFERRTFVERNVKYYEALVGMERPEDAAAAAELILKVDDSASTYAALAAAALRTGKVSEVHLQQARKALELAPQPSVETVTTLVRVLQRLGRNEEAAGIVREQAEKFSDPEGAAAIRELLPGPTP
ncbi:MAG TPA: thioredoxin family protein [Phycisphaerae bacterium]|nr:thioredoxin family protein [Phycisphaerae bacterium]HNU43820.1 thioredoxin family protein [Phycisphaerae bacterium]